ncbi:MAG: glycogen debranching protein GlgX [Actinobacteria bacterium]|nr:glycogen debranching protein GlgX [Actinomycetota bacterium]
MSGTPARSSRSPSRSTATPGVPRSRSLRSASPGSSRAKVRSRTPGLPLPLGARWDGSATNFSVFSAAAERVDLCLFGDDGSEERVALSEGRPHHWCVALPGVGPGQRYGFRADGPWNPSEGHRFNPAKLLMDPYARAMDGAVRHDGPNLSAGRVDDAAARSDEDSAAAMPRSVVIDEGFDWEGDRPPARPWDDTILYEAHVRGLTAQHPDVREDLRGTYAGIAAEATIAHLTGLGVTALELLPVHQIADEPFLPARGLTNYWGYSTLGFFAPHGGYAATGTRGEQVREFKGMVKALHRAGIEVILDVVYNHTAEGGPDGPVLAFRGLDNATYYWLDPADRSRYVDFTGTGNSLDATQPSVLRMILDSLRYWVEEMHVDGFRFDLATTLGRERDGFDPRGGFFDAMFQDPVLSRVKLIAEPWDVGMGGYQVGGFPIPWAEWNGVYRDSVRDFWRGQGNGVSDLATRLGGSSDRYGRDRGPCASVNFVTAHDGFTLADLVSYDGKHNEANGEDNRDGTDDNRSWNGGAEGPTLDPTILALRRRQQRNILMTLLLSQGVPMLLAGDELGKSQDGNNNVYCQNGPISWLDWSGADEGLHEFARTLVAIRRANAVFRRPAFLRGSPTDASPLPDVWWFRTDGRQLAARDWARSDHRTLGMFLNGHAITSDAGDDSFIVLINGAQERLRFRLPSRRFGNRWEVVLSSGENDVGRVYPFRTEVIIEDHTTLLLRRVRTQ